MPMPGEDSEAQVPKSAFEWHRQNATGDDGRLATEAAREEWDNVVTLQTICNNANEEPPSTHLTYREALHYFQGLDMSHHMENIQVEVQRRGLCTLLSCLIGPPRLDSGLTTERDLVFAIAQCRLDVSEPVHVRMLQSVYHRLTGASPQCPTFGSHWEHVGFQGSDPGQDLRGVGMLGLLQLLYLCSSPPLGSLARRLYRLSIDAVQHFPLAILSLNLSRASLQALRRGQLSRECNERQAVLEVVNDFYAALLYHMVHIWTTQRKTIRDSGYVLKDVECFCCNNVRAVLKNLQAHTRGGCEVPGDKFCFRESFHDLRTQAKSEVFI